MFCGMTGFGVGQEENQRVEVRAEIRSWNNRGLDILVKGPLLFPEWESSVRQRVKEKGIFRGSVRVDIFVHLREAEYNVVVNKGLLHSLLKEISGLPAINLDTLSFCDLMRVPGLVQFSLKDPSEVVPPILRAVDRALRALIKCRQEEGREMFLIVQQLMNEIVDLSNKMKTRLDVLDREGFFAVGEDVHTLRKDVYEEISRLKMNIKIFKQKMKQKGPKGRELDFIAQEILREANTFLAKIVDRDLSLLALSMKVKVDRIREVVQNVE